MIRLARRYRFSASHRLHSTQLTDPANAELYGKCNNPYGHGHDYELDVSVYGPIDKNGRVVDPAALDALVADTVLRDFSNRNLNLDVPEFQDLTPTSENIVLVIEKRLESKWAGSFPEGQPHLHKVLLRETRRNRFELNHEEQ